MVTIITGATRKPVSSEQLAGFFQNRGEKYSGYLYIGYPIIGTAAGAFPIDALYVSEDKGMIIFNLIEGGNIGNYAEDQDDSANKMEAKLRGYSSLVNRRRLCVDINVITFAPAASIDGVDADYPLCDERTLEDAINHYRWDDHGAYADLISVLQAVSTIRKGGRKREANKSESRGMKLRQIEDSIANLDNRQSRAVIETVEGVQRIRGLAGSGKTIVLALKAAYLHAQHPEWKIAVTFNTKSLKGQYRRLINTFYIEQTNEEPDWENLQIIQAWGAPGGGERYGIYYTFCARHNCEYLDFMTAKERYGQADVFSSVCKKALQDIAASGNAFPCNHCALPPFL
jgi:superfamily I DNA and RNA helicase